MLLLFCVISKLEKNFRNKKVIQKISKSNETFTFDSNFRACEFYFLLYFISPALILVLDQIPSEQFAPIRLSCRVFLPASNQHHVLAQRQHRHLKNISLDSAGARIRSPANGLLPDTLDL